MNLHTSQHGSENLNQSNFGGDQSVVMTDNMSQSMVSSAVKSGVAKSQLANSKIGKPKSKSFFASMFTTFIISTPIGCGLTRLDGVFLDFHLFFLRLRGADHVPDHEFLLRRGPVRHHVS